MELKKYSEKFLEINSTYYFIVKNGYTVDCSPGLYETLGYIKEEFLKLEITEIIVPSERDELESYRRKLRKVDGQHGIVFQFLKKDGSECFFKLEAFYDIETDYVFGHAEDVTEQMQYRKILEKTQEMAHIGYWRVDVKEETCYWSKKTYEIHEEDLKKEIKVEEGINYYVPEHREIISKCVEEGINQKKDWDVELQILTARGRKKWVRAVGSPIFVKNEVRFLEGTFQDIDERKRASIELESVKNKLSFALESANLGTWDWNMKTSQVYYDKRWCEIVGLRQEDVLMDFSTWDKLVHPVDKELALRKVDQYIKGKVDIYDSIFRMKHQAGHWVYIYARGQFSKFDRVGVPVKFTGTHLDITNLEESKLKALEASRSKSEFLASISHEIRTPMNGILGLSQILETEINNPEHLDKIKVIKECGENLITLINDILDYSKIEANKFKLVYERFTMDPLINRVVRVLSPKMDDKKLELYLNNKIDGNIHYLGDKQRISQVLFNLLGNAIKFTQKGKISVQLNGEVIDDIHYLNISVQDTGIGIPKDALPKLFNPFVQANQRTSRKFGGTGLGLSISRKLANLMGGDIIVSSKENEGSLFCLSIPLMILPEIKDSKEVKISELIEEAKDLQVLVAEDNRVNTKVIESFLNRLGVKADFVENGLEVLAKLNHRTYDLILMDIQMPKMDGLSAAQEIRKERQFDKIKIIALTANAFSEDRDKCISVGMNDFLSKPLKLKKLIDVFNRAIQDDSRFIDDKIDPQINEFDLLSVEMKEKILRGYIEKLKIIFSDIEKDLNLENRENIIKKLYFINSLVISLALKDCHEQLQQLFNSELIEFADLDELHTLLKNAFNRHGLIY